MTVVVVVIFWSGVGSVAWLELVRESYSLEPHSLVHWTERNPRETLR